MNDWQSVFFVSGRRPQPDLVCYKRVWAALLDANSAFYSGMTPSTRLMVLFAAPAAAFCVWTVARKVCAAVAWQLVATAVLACAAVVVAYEALSCDGVVGAVQSVSKEPTVTTLAALAVSCVARAMPPLVGETVFVQGHGRCTVRSKRNFLGDRVILAAKHSNVEELYVAERTVLSWGFHVTSMTKVDRAGGMAVLHSRGAPRAVRMN